MVPPDRGHRARAATRVRRLLAVSLEAARWFESVLEHAERLEPERRVDALQSLAHFGTHLDWERRRELAEESLSLARLIGDAGRIEWSLRRLGNVYLEKDAGEARRILLECEALARELPEKGRLAWIQQNLGLLALTEQRWDEARRRLQESIELFEQLGARWQAVNALDCLGLVETKSGRLVEARRILLECLPRAVEIEAWPNVVDCLFWGAELSLFAGDADAAAKLVAFAASFREREGWKLDEYDTDVVAWPRTAEIARRQLGSGFEAASEEGRRLHLEDAVALALREVAADP
jgi:tetratricopeptide (TPR) repeat protein